MFHPSIFEKIHTCRKILRMDLFITSAFLLKAGIHITASPVIQAIENIEQMQIKDVFQFFLIHVAML